MRKKHIGIVGCFVFVLVLLFLYFSLMIGNESPSGLVPEEIAEASRDFKNNNIPPQNLQRSLLADKLAPYIKNGMSKKQVEELLGVASSKSVAENNWRYETSLSTFIRVRFDDQGDVVGVDGVGYKKRGG